MLAEVLNATRAAVVLSGYRCALMDRLYNNWVRIDADSRLCNSSKGERTESAWLNFDPDDPPIAPGEDSDGNLRLLEQPVRQCIPKNGRRKQAQGTAGY